MGAIDRGKEIIKDAIRVTERGLVARIPVADQANLAVFEKASRAADVQRMLTQKGVRVEFYIPDPVEQCKKQMMDIIRTASAEVQEIVFPYLAEDYADAEIALASPEIQQALRNRRITASLRLESQPQIVIASIDQVISSEFNRYFRERE
ncbi:hypothetical protein [Nostoc sp. FACHB-110]|uniref:hypothetical protein n=1 Tax=Nostoc sp. FACHB-110 TaxID=2692834 RepID=UPI001688D69A|nr:hypothetical protein [Nostoc sp. FACHB-110]MBD2438274.1 hypothetical protein [Nostoc sp. FACHB-110]